LTTSGVIVNRTAERIFDPFTTQEGGLGLDLSIGRTIIENHPTMGESRSLWG
jgi:nitrogen-specific signal transduction histidine kinase